MADADDPAEEPTAPSVTFSVSVTVPTGLPAALPSELTVKLSGFQDGEATLPAAADDAEDAPADAPPAEGALHCSFRRELGQALCDEVASRNLEMTVFGGGEQITEPIVVDLRAFLQDAVEVGSGGDATASGGASVEVKLTEAWEAKWDEPEEAGEEGEEAVKKVGRCRGGQWGIRALSAAVFALRNVLQVAPPPCEGDVLAIQ